ncbi:MAG: flagellar basal body-associated FliL family protein [Bdellovibrionales bacterium]|nr:flagellar basal body-associated FliL family protein [Bdellovibrionales bacterium]
MAEENVNSDEIAEKPPRDWKKLLVLLFVVVNVGGVGAGAFVVYKNSIGYVADPLQERIEKEKYVERIRYFEDKPIVYTMDPFVINLTGKPSKTIQLELSLEMLSEVGYEEVISKTTETRDKIVRILNEKSYKDLESIQGKLILKDQITVALNQYLNSGVVKGIYFTNFIVQ